MIRLSQRTLATTMQRRMVLVPAVVSLVVAFSLRQANQWPISSGFGFKLKPFSSFLNIVPSSMQTTFTSLKPPQPPPRWNHSAHEIIKLTEDAIAQDRKAKDTISVVPVNECNFTTVRHSPVSITIDLQVILSCRSLCVVFTIKPFLLYNLGCSAAPRRGRSSYRVGDMYRNLLFNIRAHYLTLDFSAAYGLQIFLCLEGCARRLF
jgi:hypothetical protein